MDSMITGDEAAALIVLIHRVGAEKGYERVRLDRGLEPNWGSYYEAGYVHGEVSVRFSHIERLRFRSDDPQAAILFERALTENTRTAREVAQARLEMEEL